MAAGKLNNRAGKEGNRWTPDRLISRLEKEEAIKPKTT
jgi:hypothetical protein